MTETYELTMNGVDEESRLEAMTALLAETTHAQAVAALVNMGIEGLKLTDDVNRLATAIHETLKIAHKPQLEDGAASTARAVADAHRAAIIYLSDFVSHAFQDAPPCTNMLRENCYSEDAAHIQ